MLYTFLIALAIFLYWKRHEWTVRPASPAQWFLLFSIVFYFYRWTFQWSTPEATIFETDAPGWVRAIRHVVLAGFILVLLAKKRFRLSPVIWYFALVIGWISFCTYIRLLAVDDSHTVLFYWYSLLEFMILAFVDFDDDLERLVKFAIGCCWIVIGFFGLEVFSGRATGFGRGGLEQRYGSIFGSPNDLGMFTVLALLGVLVFSKHISQPMKTVLSATLTAMLVLTGSRGAMVGLVAGMIAIWPLAKKWLSLVVMTCAAIYGSLVTVFRDTGFVDELLLRLTNQSAVDRLYEIQEVRTEVMNWGPLGMFFGTLHHIHQENFFLSILLRGGFLGLFLFLSLVVSTLLKARHPFLRAGLVSFLTASCFTPYPDAFPSNVFLWLMVGVAWQVAEAHAPKTLKYGMLNPTVT